MPLVLIAPPADPVLTLAEVKEYLRVDHDDDDARISGFIAAATARMDGRDGVLGRALKPQTWRSDMQGFPDTDIFYSTAHTARRSAIDVPLAPTISVDSIDYFAGDGSRVVLSSSAYRVVSGGVRGDYIVPAFGTDWPSVYEEPQPDMVRVTFTAGYTDDVPEPIRVAIMMLIGDMYENRVNTIVGTNVAQLPMAVEMIIAPFRLIPLA